MQSFVDLSDIMTGFWKSLSFGVIVTWVCTYKGFTVGHGAEGVAKATTDAVVLSSVLILVWDYFMARCSRDRGRASRSRRRGESVIKVERLVKWFDGQQVLHEVDLEVATGSVTGIIGRSGGGKTVLLRHLIRLLRPDGGRGLVDGLGGSP